MHLGVCAYYAICHHAVSGIRQGITHHGLSTLDVGTKCPRASFENVSALVFGVQAGTEFPDTLALNSAVNACLSVSPTPTTCNKCLILS